MSSTTDNQPVIDSLNALVQALTQDTANARAIAADLGRIESGGEPNVPFKVQPKNAIFSAVRVVHKTETGEPTQVNLTLATPLPMQALVKAFGEYEYMPRSTKPEELPRVSFDIEGASTAKTVSLIASYEDDDDGRVTKITVFRDS